MLSIKNLTVSLDKKIVIKNLSLDIAKGTITVLMGPNGSGKSTLAYTLMGHPSYAHTLGEVIFLEQNILELPVEKRARAGIFLACQYPQEVPGVQVTTFLKEAYRMLVRQDITAQDFQQKLYLALDAVKLDHSFAYRYLNEGFSGGEKKRLEIVQMLLLQPKIAILDEIDSGLDVDAIKLVADAILHARTVCPDIVIIIITHYQKILDYIQPDRVHILVEGSLVASGTKELAQRINQQGYDALSI